MARSDATPGQRHLGSSTSMLTYDFTGRVAGITGTDLVVDGGLLLHWSRPRAKTLP
ncbi:MAG: hypothetical protein P1U83_04295 [Roseovarius sp.]|nr:hypothetical protein [Roseovarius sp.]